MALTTGRPPRPPGSPSPAAAIAAAPVATWPLTTVADDGRRVDMAGALGPGGPRVAVLLERIATSAPVPDGLDLAASARATPGGPVTAPLAVVGLAEAAEVATAVDPPWLAVVDARRSAPRAALVAAGRETELEAALHLAMLLATVALEDGSPPEARVASGARLWLLGGAVAWALLNSESDLGSHRNDPFAPWAELVSYGIWPVGPVAGRLVMCVEPLSSIPPSDKLSLTTAKT